MRKNFISALLTFILFLLQGTTIAQVPALVKQGPSGVFIFMGKNIPTGSTISAYKIECSVDHKGWKQIAEIKTPSGFAAFSKAVESAKAFFPVQPMPSSDKLSMLYQKAIATGTTDSLKDMRLLFPIRVGLGILYYDTTARKPATYQYRVTAIKPSGEKADSFTSESISKPFKIKFDSISYSESSYNQNSLVVLWKSAGSNPAPQFMVYKFRYGAPVTVKGSTSIYSVNDTTYYSYTDTSIKSENTQEMQFFVSPYDHFGNSGTSSQVAVITMDNFNKAGFVKNKIGFKPALSGIQINWHFTDPVTVKHFVIFRSESPQAGYQKLAEASAYDTLYIDKQLWPEKTYYYYIQAVAKAGKRTKKTEILSAIVPGIKMSEKMNAPVLRQVSLVNNHVRLLIEVNDTLSTHIRIFRGKQNALVTLPVLIKVDKAAVLTFTDSTLAKEELKDIYYAVRNEIPKTGISSLSGELPVSIDSNSFEIAYIHGYMSKGKIELFWDDVLSRKSPYTSYTLARQYGQANSKSPLQSLSENLTSARFTDDKVQADKQYTYVLRLVDASGNFPDKSYKVTVPTE